MISLCEDFSVPAPVHERLYPYQREGVQWMWRVYKGIRDVRGGILGEPCASSVYAQKVF